MAEFIFKNVLNFKMQVWVLIYYSIYNHRLEVARQIALDRGDVRRLKSAQLENFSNFIIENLDVFLSGDQKQKLLASLIKQSFDSNGAVRFEHFDFDALQSSMLNVEVMCKSCTLQIMLQTPSSKTAIKRSAMPQVVPLQTL